MNSLDSWQSLLDDEPEHLRDDNDKLEHLRSKLAAAEKQLGTASDKTEQKILKDMITVFKQQIRIAEENDPACIKAREKEAAEKKRMAEQKKKERRKATYNKIPIIVGALIIAFTIGLCVIIGINAARSHTYVSLFSTVSGAVCLFTGFAFTVLIFTVPFDNKLYLLGSISLILGGSCMGVGSTVSKDAPHGSPEAVIGGMFLICAGVIFIVVYYWYNTGKCEQVKTKRREEAAKAAAKEAANAAIKVRYDNFCKTNLNIGRLREKKNSRLASYILNSPRIILDVP